MFTIIQIKVKNKMNRNTIQKIFVGFFITACIFIGLRVSNIASNFENSNIPKQN